MFRSFSGPLNDEWTVTISLLPKPNKDHDGYAIRPNNLVVSDGATPLEESWGSDLYHWVGTLSGLMAHNGKDMEKSLPEVWAEAVTFNNTIFDPRGLERTMGSSHVRFNGSDLEYLVVGDTKLVMKHVDGSFTEVFDTRLDYWEEKADRLIDQGKLTGRAAAWHNRLRANTVGGYEVMCDDPTVGYRAIGGRVPAAQVSDLLLCSDGFWRLFSSPEEMLHAATASPDRLKKNLERLQPADDLTVAWVKKN